MQILVKIAPFSRFIVWKADAYQGAQKVGVSGASAPSPPKKKKKKKIDREGVNPTCNDMSKGRSS